jgi:hypothetical protein
MQKEKGNRLNVVGINKSRKESGRQTAERTDITQR